MRRWIPPCCAAFELRSRGLMLTLSQGPRCPRRPRWHRRLGAGAEPAGPTKVPPAPSPLGMATTLIAGASAGAAADRRAVQATELWRAKCLEHSSSPRRSGTGRFLCDRLLRKMGGLTATRGLLLQAWMLRLDSREPATSLTDLCMARDYGSEKVDILWRDPDGVRAVQVKFSSSTMGRFETRC